MTKGERGGVGFFSFFLDFLFVATYLFLLFLLSVSQNKSARARAGTFLAEWTLEPKDNKVASARNVHEAWTRSDL